MHFSIKQAFDPKLNALNAVRLVLALSVIVWHSLPLTGAPSVPHPVTQLLGDVGVDGFFAISGFLIVSSWNRRPEWWAFLKARVLRILPAFYVCLLVTAAVIAPLSALVGGHPLPDGYLGSAVLYVVRDAGLEIFQYGIAGTPTHVPYPGVWNGSLWTLWWEFLCYLAVLAFGLTRAFKFRATIPVLFLGCLIAAALTASGVITNFYIVHGSRFGLMFAAGALIYQFQHRIPARWWLAGIAALVIVGASFLPDYRLIAAIPLAYLVITAGTLIKIPALRLQNDVSYGTYIYAFPLQQLLASAGLYVIGVPLFAALSIALTLLVATASWHLVEKPALRLKKARAIRSVRKHPVVHVPAEPVVSDTAEISIASREPVAD